VVILTWAATVWDLVGNNLERHAVLKPASARPKAAYMNFKNRGKTSLLWVQHLLRLLR